MTPSFDTAMQPYGSNKVKPVQEPAVYGAVLVSICILLLAYRKYGR